MISESMWRLLVHLILRERDAATCEKLKRLYHELQLKKEREMVLLEQERRKNALRNVDNNILALEEAIIGLSDNKPATEALLDALVESCDFYARELYRVTLEQKKEAKL